MHIESLHPLHISRDICDMFYNYVIQTSMNLSYFWHVSKDSLRDAMALSMSFGSKVMPACITKMLV